VSEFEQTYLSSRREQPGPGYFLGLRRGRESARRWACLGYVAGVCTATAAMALLARL
jgi:hypothetical protein